MSSNIQRPFAYLPKPVKKPGIPLNIKWAYLPSNYVAMCVTCLQPYQKTAKLCSLCTVRPQLTRTAVKRVENIFFACCTQCDRRLLCTKCRSGSIKKFPSTLLPWILLPPDLPHSYGFYTYLQANTAFHCSLCGISYASLAVYSSLCITCDKHNSPKNGYFTCRYCCLLVDKKLLKAIDRVRETVNIDIYSPPKRILAERQIINTTFNPPLPLINFRFRPPAENAAILADLDTTYAALTNPATEVPEFPDYELDHDTDED